MTPTAISETDLQAAEKIQTTCGLYRLAAVTLVRVSGEDARSWLNGQITQDVRNTTGGAATYALVVHVKGKIVSDLVVLTRKDDFVLLIPTGAAEEVLATFDKFIIMEDVTLTRESSMSALTIQGPLSTSVRTAAKASGLEWFPHDRLGTGGFDVIGPTDEIERAYPGLRQEVVGLGGTELSNEAWGLAHLWQGVPRFGIDFGNQNYPQEAGLHGRAVSFNKGCYIGQEVICMLENRGQLTRRLVELSVSAKEAVSPETPLVVEGRQVGQTTSSGPTRDSKGTLALGYLKRQLAEPGTQLSLGPTVATVARVIGTP